MFDHYGYKYECEFRIYTADDDRDSYNSTRVDLYCTYENNQIASHFRRAGQYYNHHIYTKQAIESEDGRFIINSHIQSRAYHKGEPLILELKNTLQDILGWGSRRSNVITAPQTFKMAFVLPESGMAVMVEKGQTYYQLMNQRVRKKNLLFALARFIYRSCFEENPQALLQYIIRMITMPENVSYVLENRTPFFYFNIKEREKVNCRLNTKMISNTEAVIEISDGIWAPIEINDLDIMVNYFYHEHARAKTWANMTPKKLWTRLMGKEPSSSQLQLMEEFLVQNRTSDMVENRAKELMASLEVKYPNRIKILDIKDGYKVMIVRGRLADWVIINSAYKTQTQKVKTFVFIDDKIITDNRNEKDPLMRGNFRGPICIDNIHTNSSLGDQYAARALALLNDNVTVKLVSTIAKYVPRSIVEGERTSRLGVKWEHINENMDYDWQKLIL